MRIIKKIVDQIYDELEGAEEYIECAMKYKEEHPSLANMYYEMSLTEMTHVDKLHNAVTMLINEVRARGETPPPEMMAIYEYEHEKTIKEATEIKVMQEMYKK